MTDELREIVLAAAADRFPPPDGGVIVVPPDQTTGLHAVLSFTGHAVVATDRSREEVLALGIDGFDGTLAPDALRALAGPDGWIGVLDVVLVARGPAGAAPPSARPGPTPSTSGSTTRPRPGSTCRCWPTSGACSPSAEGWAAAPRSAGRWSRPAGARGSAGRCSSTCWQEMPVGAPIFASCAPGNARSLRSLLAAGFRVIGAENLIRPVR